MCNIHACPVDCIMSDWSDWTTCTVSCGGGGTQSHSRSVVRAAEYGGAVCPEVLQTRSCGNTIANCPVDCIVGDWSVWELCSTSCGGGVHQRTRPVTRAAQHGGLVCAATHGMRRCNTQPCPVDCVASDWSAWGSCSVSCGVNGGLQSRQRSESRPAAYGGKACTAHKQERVCNAFQCPLDCVESSWSDWSECSKTCGAGGTKRRSRSVVVATAFGGATCSTELSQAAPCNEGPCPVHCKVSEWPAWAQCSVSCGGGSQSRSCGVVEP